MKLLIHSQNSTAATFKFGNRGVTSFTLYNGCYYSFMLSMHANSCQQKGLRWHAPLYINYREYHFMKTPIIPGAFHFPAVCHWYSNLEIKIFRPSFEKNVIKLKHEHNMAFKLENITSQWMAFLQGLSKRGNLYIKTALNGSTYEVVSLEGPRRNIKPMPTKWGIFCLYLYFI